MFYFVVWSIPHTTTDTSEMQRVRAKKSQRSKPLFWRWQFSVRTWFKRLQWWPLHDWRNLKIPTSKESYWTRKRKKIKVCIPVGCLPAARWPYPGVCFPGGGGFAPRGSLHRGAGPGGGVCSGGGGGVVLSQHVLRHTPPLTESQTPVKTLPWPNFVAAGKNLKAQIESQFSRGQLLKLDRVKGFWK